MQAEPANRASTKTVVRRVKLEEGRPLHLKSLWLQNDRVVLLMMGSSNFTSAGLGLGSAHNLEANLAYAVGANSGEAGSALKETWLEVEYFPEGFRLRWQPRAGEGEDAATTDVVPLLAAFDQAHFGCDERQQAFIELTFSGVPPAGWMLAFEDDREPFLTEGVWQTQGSPPEMRLPWSRQRAPSGFAVSWSQSGGSAWWPVNVLSPNVLPPPPELKDLSLEILIDILTSARPLIRIIGDRHRPKKTAVPLVECPIVDPHKRRGHIGLSVAAYASCLGCTPRLAATARTIGCV